MDPWMNERTREEVLAKKRERYARAGKEHKAKILDEVIELFGYHRKADLRLAPAEGGGGEPQIGRRLNADSALVVVRCKPGNIPVPEGDLRLMRSQLPNFATELFPLLDVAIPSVRSS
jgi:hypothetical protein